MKIGERYVTLEMAKRAYDGLGGCEGGEARFHYLTALHFEPDNWAKMRFFLAAQVLSQTMCAVIAEYCEKVDGRTGGPTEQEYRGYVDVCQNCDLLVDIFNGTEKSKRTGESKGGKKLMRNVETDADSRKILGKLKGILLFFDTWRKGCKDEKTDFMTSEGWEGLRQIICGNVEHIEFYSKKFGDTFTWDFKAGGSDVCELHFANQRAEGHGGAVTVRMAKRNAEKSINMALPADTIGGNTKYYRLKDPAKQKELERNEQKGKAVQHKQKWK